MAQQKLYEEAKNWEKRNSDVAFQEIDQEFESQRFQLHQANRWADQAQRDKKKISLYGDWNWEMDSSKKIMQEIAKKLKNWEEFAAKNHIEQDKQELRNCLCFKRGNPTTVSQLLTQIRELQNKINSLSDARENNDPETGSSSGATHVPDQDPYYSESPNLAALRIWIAAWYTKLYGCYKKHIWTTNCSRTTILYNLRQFKEFGILLSGIETLILPKLQGEERGDMKRESLNTSIASLHFQSRSGMLNHTGGTYSHKRVMDYPGFPISELNLGKFPDCGISKLESQLPDWGLSKNSRSSDHHMRWIKEVEISKSIDELVTSRSIVVWRDFPDYDRLDARLHWKIFSTRIFTSGKEYVSKSSALKKYDRFLRGRQIAYMIYEHFSGHWNTPVPRFQRGAGILHHTTIWWITRDFRISDMHLGKFKDSMEFQTKLGKSIQGCSLLKNSRSSSHNALDQWSCDSKAHWRTCDIAIDYSAAWFSWIRYAWCDGCVCIAKASQHADTLPKMSKCRIAPCSKTGKILTRKTKLRTSFTSIPCNRSLWSSTRTLRLVSL